MKIVLVNSNHLSGGAARAMLRLHHGLAGQGVDTDIVVQQRDAGDPPAQGPQGMSARAWKMCRILLDQLPVMAYPGRTDAVFAPSWLPDTNWRRINALRPDIVNLHWITKSFLCIESLARINAPLVWTMHDMWPMSGGCHYDDGCGRYRAACGRCPELGSTRERDLSRRTFLRKQRTYDQLDLTIVTPSHWLADCARASTLLSGKRIEVIPNGIDTAWYRRADKAAARAALGLPADGRVILFGAMDATENRRKGFPELRDALGHLAAGAVAQDTIALVFGAERLDDSMAAGMPVVCCGNLDDVRLVQAYSAADVFVAPSRQENLSNAVMEALACGTPCVAFRVGGMPDMIDHQLNGYLAQPGDAADLARGIAWVLDNTSRWAELSGNARAKVESEFTMATCAAHYLSLYREVCERRED